jgi:enoyl-CoA hydratase/carnithine racemase
MEHADIDLDRDGPVAHLRLNRPAKLNALDQRMVRLLAQRCAEIDHARHIRLVSAGQAMEAAKELAAGILKRGPRATELAKMMINSAEGDERERITEVMAGAHAAFSPELTEGLAAFHARRVPDFGKGKDDA